MATTQLKNTIALGMDDRGTINRVVIGGLDISNQTLGLNIEGAPGHTTVTLRLTAADMDLPTFAAHVIADETTTQFLKQLGWTPPIEAQPVTESTP